MTKSTTKKIFIKICKILGYEIIDQNEFYSPTLNKSIDNNLSNNNKSIILDIRNSISIDIELGGGIKTENDVSFWIKNGVNFLIIGSLAIKNSDYVKFVTN